MIRQRGARPSRGQQHETPLQAWQKDVQRLGLQDVLSSFPAPGSFRFNKVRKNGHDTVTMFLGNRPNPNGSTSQVWARIVPRSERKDFQPPLIFYDEELSGTFTIQYPRSASSLLRKATLLLPPFCFLQHDLVDESTNVRELLSAVILNLAAAADVDASAWRWDKFGDSLIQALRYIDSRGAFHSWRHQRKLAALAQTKPSNLAKEVQDESNQDTHAELTGNAHAEDLNTVSTTSNGRYRGGTVRSRGSDIAISPNTSLAKLKRELGDRRFKMLDEIPPKPMTISPHDLGGSLFPFRMFVGTAVYQETEEVIDVYAYIDHDEGKTSMYFMSHDKTGLEQMYDVNDMREGVDLVQPLEYLNNLKKVSYKNDAKSARTAKLRSLVSYYFFLAENQGLISNPRIDVHEAFGKRLCAVCKELSVVKWGNDDNSADATSTALPALHVLTASRTAETAQPDRSGVKAGSTTCKGCRNASHVPFVSRCLVSAASLGNKDAVVCAEACQAIDAGYRDLRRLVLMNDSTLSKKQQATVASIDSRSSAHPTGLVNATLQDKSRALGIDLDRFISKTICYIKAGESRRSEKNSFETVIAEHEIIGVADTFDWALFGRAACFPGNNRPAMASFLLGPLSIQSGGRATGANTKQLSRGQPIYVQVVRGSEHISVDNSQPTATPRLSPASSISPTKAIVAPPNSDLQLVGDTQSLLATQLGGKRHLTPEGSEGRDKKIRAVSTERPRRAEQGTLALDYILNSDTEDGRLPRPAPWSVVDRTTAARKCVRDTVVDLTQLSSSPRGKKMKSLRPFYLSDSESDVIAETDGSEWRQRCRGRRN